MNDAPKKHLPEGKPPAREKSGRSGEGADTALEAMIRKRRQAESHDTPDSMLPPPDATPDPVSKS